MKELKHEPGPWVLGGCSGRMITTPDGYVGDGFIADVDTLANARLIAAAPELLEALLRVRAQFDQAGYSPVAGSLNPVEDNYAFINSVIAKALGESQ